MYLSLQGQGRGSSPIPELSHMAPVRFYSSIDEEIVIERLDKAPRLSISILIWILSSDTI